MRMVVQHPQRNVATRIAEVTEPVVAMLVATDFHYGSKLRSSRDGVMVDMLYDVQRLYALNEKQPLVELERNPIFLCYFAIFGFQ